MHLFITSRRKQTSRAALHADLTCATGLASGRRASVGTALSGVGLVLDGCRAGPSGKGQGMGQVGLRFWQHVLSGYRGAAVGAGQCGEGRGGGGGAWGGWGGAGASETRWFIYHDGVSC